MQRRAARIAVWAAAFLVCAVESRGQDGPALPQAPPAAQRLPPLTELLEPLPSITETPPPTTATLPGGTPLVIIEPPDSPPKPYWEHNLQVGVKGARGNANNFSSRIALEGKRTDTNLLTTYSATYAKGWAEGEETENDFQGIARNEWLFPGSRYSLFLTGSTLYDEFQAFDVRVQAAAGVGYALISRETLTLKSRLGAGASREIGGPDDAFVPELDLGFEFEWKVTARQTIKMIADYYPAIDDPGDFRLESRAAWEVLVDPDWNMSMQLGVTDRYDSTPHGLKPNDFDYSFLLLWKI